MRLMCATTLAIIIDAYNLNIWLPIWAYRRYIPDMIDAVIAARENCAYVQGIRTGIKMHFNLPLYDAKMIVSPIAKSSRLLCIFFSRHFCVKSSACVRIREVVRESAQRYHRKKTKIDLETPWTRVLKLALDPSLASDTWDIAKSAAFVVWFVCVTSIGYL